jgi:hypothetical protein
MEYPSILFWLLFLFALRSKGPAVYYLFFSSWAFGTLAVIPPNLIGGISLTPAWVAAGLLSGKIIADVGMKPFFASMIDPRRFGLLTLCTLYALVSALFLPRAFEGRVDVIVMRLVTIAAPQALGPSASNFTQSFYFVITSLTTVSLYFAAADKQRRLALMQAFRFGATVTIATGIVDLVAAGAGLSALLAPFRNAAYALMTDDEVMNVKRVVGLTPEASAYAGLGMSFLALQLLQSPYPKSLGGGPLVKWSLCLGLLAATYMSTSSGGFVGLAAMAAVALAIMTFDAFTLRRRALLGLLLPLSLACIVLGLWIWWPDAFERPFAMIDALVFHKTASSSYIERSMWNRIAYQAFLGTHGFGAGMGSVRASSWIFAVLGNIGLPGALLLAGFMVQVLLAGRRGAAPEDARLMRATKLALIPNLLIASLSGTSVGYGLGVAWLLALSAAIAWPLKQSQPESARIIPLTMQAIAHRPRNIPALNARRMPT